VPIPDMTWDQVVTEALARGAKVLAPNGLPPKMLAARPDGEVLMENPYCDRPGYLFPIDVQWRGMAGAWELVHDEYAFMGLTPEGLLTIYEGCDCKWDPKTGACLGGFCLWDNPSAWRIAPESLAKIHEHLKSLSPGGLP
jgi:hypothetical protein